MRPEDSSVAIIQGVNAPHQFSYENGIVLTDVGPGYAKGELIIGPDSINPHGNVHGGALSTLADTVGGCCACSKGAPASPPAAPSNTSARQTAAKFTAPPPPKSWAAPCRW